MDGRSTAFDVVLGAVGHRIRRCHQISVALFNEEVGPFDLTTVQYAALDVIAANDDLDATRLAAMVAFDRSTVGAVLERLEAKGLIERAYRNDDKRTKRLAATPAGRALLAQVHDAVHRSQHRFLEVLDADERRTFLDLLAAVIVRHEKEGGADPTPRRIT
ncbi:MAG: MarR family transcriptional regulator [Candidatus Lustribacter sp.]